MSHYDCEPNRWKGFVLGMTAGLAGLMAMRYYWQHIAPLLSEAESDDQNDQPDPLDDISLVGKQYQEGESSTAALGRLAYEQLAGESPRTQETKTMLSYLVHWGYGILQGGLYGVLRGNSKGLDIKGGLGYGAGLWLFGDEAAVPMLGLQDGPAAASTIQHLNRLGAHLAYGVGTSVATQILRRIF